MWLSDVELAARDAVSRAAVDRRSAAVERCDLARFLASRFPDCRAYVVEYRAAVAELDQASDAAEAALNAAFARFCGSEVAR